ncbi:MAG: caspase family protein [Reyranellaceae bacterium]
MSRFVLVIAVLLGFCAPSWAQKEIRVALVIGNGAYQNAEPLKNPVNDARAMAKVLKDAGFEVIARENVTRRAFVEALYEFSGKVPPGGVGLFYYAGHGLQVRGINHLVPVDAALANERDVKYETIDLNDVLSGLDEARARLSLVILDACRDNPFARRFRSGGSRGLAQADAPRGTVIAYATAPGDTAADGDGDNGVYTAELLKAIAQPGLKLEEVFKRTIDGVARVTANKQTPWVSSSFRGDFLFHAAAVNVPPPAPPPPVASVPAPRPAVDPVEQTAWTTIASSNNPVMFELFLKRFPNGVYADFARAKLEELKMAAVMEEKRRSVAIEEAKARAAAEEAKARAAAEEAKARAAAEETRRLAAAEEAKRKAGADAARRATEDEARRVAAAEEAKRKADAEAKRAADEEAKRQAAAEEARRRAAAEDEKKSVENVEAALKLADIDRKRIQAALTAKGFDTLGADGAFGPRTRQMIGNWQRSRSEPPTGYLTATQAALLMQEGQGALARIEDERRKADEERRKAEAERAKAAPPPAPAAPAPAAPAPSAPPAPQVASIAPGGSSFDGAWVGQVCAGSSRCGPASVQISRTRLSGTSSARGITHNLEGTVLPGGQVRVRYTGMAPPGTPNANQPFDWTLSGTASGNSLSAQVTNAGGVTFRLSLQRTR